MTPNHDLLSPAENRPPRGEDRAERGIALLATLLVLMVLFVAGIAILAVADSSFKESRAYSGSVAARHVAGAGIQQIIARQNDLYEQPRYLFNPSSFQGDGPDPHFVNFALKDPETNQGVGTAVRQVVGKDPRVDPPPYTIVSTGQDRTSAAVIRAQIAPISLLEYAVYSEDNITIAPNITVNGKTYSAASITLNGPPIIFNADVEYVGSLVNQGYGTFNAAVKHLPAAYPPLTELVDLNQFESASKAPGGCTSGIGLYIGPDAGAKHNPLFERSSGIYQIDLTLFDLSGPADSPVRAVTYNGTTLKRFDDNQQLKEFNGVIFVEGELHIWGILGGRSVEDATVLDRSKPLPSSKWYPGPAGSGNNLYSNNRLDQNEDGTGGGQANGILDPRKLGMSLTIVTGAGADIVIDHNVFVGAAPDSRPVRMALISGDAIKVAADSPKTIVCEAALLATGHDSNISWEPLGSASTHQDSYWAKGPVGTYVYDLDDDGIIETNNGQGQSGDRDETSVLAAWSLINHGNLITAKRPVSGVWASDGHIRTYAYDPALIVAEPPCYPVIPFYGIVPGTWAELR